MAASNLILQHLRKTGAMDTAGGDIYRRYASDPSVRSYINTSSYAKLPNGGYSPNIVKWNGNYLGRTNPASPTLSWLGGTSGSSSGAGGGGGGGGRRGGGGGGGGYAAPKLPPGEKYYAGNFDTTKYRSQAEAQADMQIAEAIRQNTAQRAQAALERDRALQEVALQQQRGAGQLATQHDTDTARLNNMMGNAGLGGGSAYSNYAVMNAANQSALADLIAGYDTQRRQYGNSFLDRLFELDEADRIARNSRPGLVEDLYGTLADRGYNMFSQDEARRLAAINQRNSLLGY